MKKSFGVQLYTVRDYLHTEEDVISAFSRIKSMGYDTVQACCPMQAVSYQKLGEIAKESGLTVCGTFDSLDSMLHTPDELAEHTKLLHTKSIGVAYASMANDAEVAQTVRDLQCASRQMKERGFTLCYHNHAHEFSRYQGKLILDYIAEQTDMEICPDTYWTQVGGGDVRQMLRKLAGRISILHLKDYAYINGAPRFAAVGSGNLYWDGIMKEAENAGVKHYIVEQDDCFGENPFDALARSIRFLEQYR
ncbi:MAG: sugar phosphate isomerase/epimerase [Clostridia bacterium]|nr:sugar phosphate isomerase/epimerase [Clostridia bacterium]